MAFLKSSAPGWRSAITRSASDHDKHNSTGDEYGSWHFDFSKAEGTRAPRVLLAISAVGALLALGMNSSYTRPTLPRRHHSYPPRRHPNLLLRAVPPPLKPPPNRRVLSS